jgi:hypothetical protein
MILPIDSIKVPVTFGTRVNFRAEYVEFTVVELHLPYNANLGRHMLYRFMVVTQYGHLVLKMLGPNNVITIPSNRLEALVAVEKIP